MMVETILESSQDFGMSNGSLPQWKRELLQRRLARARPPACPAPAAPPPPPPPPPPPHDEDEELRYGPGIVKRLKSRYLSLALRDAPRRRPSVLRRAASLEHLLDERPPAAPAPRAPRAPRPASLGVPLALAAQRRDCVKRARSVDALSRLESRDELAPPPSPPPPAPAPRPPRSARPPLRPQPLLREAERPPPDVVRSTLRKFESAPARRPAPPARLVPRDPSPCSSPPATPPPPAPTSPPPPPPPLPPPVLPSPAPPAWSPPQSPEPACLPSPPRSPAPKVPTVSQVAPTPTPPRPVPAPKIVRTARAAPLVRVPTEARSPTEETAEEPPSADEVAGCEASASASASAEARRVSRAALEGIARAGSTVRYAFPAARAASHLPPLAATNPVLAARGLRRVGVIRPLPPAEPARAASPESPPPAGKPAPAPAPAPTERDSPPPAEEDGAPRVNGHSTPEPHALSRIGAAGIERAWSGSAARRPSPSPCAAPAPAPVPAPAAPWLRTGRARAPPPPATSVVFNFSDRKEVPDYIENDGIILRASRRSRVKAPAGAAAGDAEEEPDGAPPSPCDVRFVNDNVLINGRSSMPLKPNKDRIAKLKLQFDDSLTRTFEYPSETSFSEEPPSPSPSPCPASAPAPAPASAPADAGAALADNTHIASAALSRYTPHKTCAAAFHLGVSRPHAAPAPAPPPPHPPSGDAPVNGAGGEEGGEGPGAGAGGDEGEQDARPCGADAAKSWSDARAHRTDLLF